MTTEFAQIIGPLAKQLLGEPNRALSSAVELRYGAHGSLSVDLAKGTWFDHEANEGGGVLDLVTRETKLQGSERLDWLKQQGLLAGRASSDQPGRGTGPDRQQQVAWYDYTDQDGNLIFQVVRYEPKDFRQRRKPRPNDPPEDVKGGWVWNVKDVKPVPYHLPQLLENDDRVVCIVEGEKSADKLLKISIPATCSAGGAGKWRNELNEYFRGADVVILPDYDPQKTHPKTGEKSSKPYYDGIIFHRVINGFMIQGGDPTGTGRGGASAWGGRFADEINPSSDVYKRGYKSGTVAMANAGPNTNGSQFFIMHVDYPLPPSYTIFGRVTEGQDIVNSIATSKTDQSDRPSEEVKMEKVTIE